MSEEIRERKSEKDSEEPTPEKTSEEDHGYTSQESAEGASPGSSEKSQRERKQSSAQEEFRKLVEESLERITVPEIVLSMMNQLASIAYLRLGLPETVNLKYRDFEQARLAIDVLDAMIRAGEGKMSPESLKPYRGTLANLKLNFVQVVKAKKEG